MRDFKETIHGSYKEPFSHWQYGGFIKRDGMWWFISTGHNPETAREAVRSYYYDMNKNARNNMDMSELDEIRVVKRKVTYGVWEEA